MPSLSVRTRFEVFKRDRFTCQYCGQTPPAVLLEVDHVIPRSVGGSDEMDNLITSCQDCNRGKSDKLLEEGSRPAISRATIEDLEERVAQAQAYAELMQTYNVLADKQYWMFIDQWADAFNAKREEDGKGTKYAFYRSWEQWPNDRSVRMFLRKLPLQTVLEAVDISASRFDGESSDGACRYFYAICWARIRKIEGR
jgi:hypothetical protein